MAVQAKVRVVAGPAPDHGWTVEVDGLPLRGQLRMSNEEACEVCDLVERAIDGDGEADAELQRRDIEAPTIPLTASTDKQVSRMVGKGTGYSQGASVVAFGVALDGVCMLQVNMQVWGRMLFSVGIVFLVIGALLMLEAWEARHDVGDC